MPPDKYHWDGDTPDERDSELRAGRMTAPRDSGYTESSLARQVRTAPAWRSRGRFWAAIGVVVLAGLLAYVMGWRGRG